MRFFGKMMTAVALAVALCGTVFSAENGELPEMPFVQTYDFYKPDGTSKMIWIGIHGDSGSRSRVSLLQGKKPKNLEEKDANGIPVKYMQISYYGGEESRAFTLINWAWHTASTTPPSREWECYVITFTPRITGKVQFRISPEAATLIRGKRYPRLQFIDVANVSATGITGKVKTPTFSKDSGIMKDWHFPVETDKDRKKALGVKIIKQDKETGFIPGGSCLRTAHNIYQEFSVKENVPVTIRFYLRAFDSFDPKY